MDTSPNSVTTEPRLSVSERGTDSEVRISSTPVDNTVAVPVRDEGPLSPASSEQPQSLSLRAPTVEPVEGIEHAYWAEYEEDTSTPSEEELKEMEGADADYSACDRECNFNRREMYSFSIRGH